MSARIRRSHTDKFFSSGRKPRLPYRLAVASEPEALDVTYKRSAWGRVVEEGEIRLRSIEGQVMSDGQHAGSFNLRELHVPLPMSGRQFMDEMDQYSQDLAHLGEVISLHWEDPSVLFDSGNVVEVHRLWMEPKLSGNGRLAQAVNALLEKEFGDRSMVILKAFPLEYEGEVNDQTEVAFKRRQAAMMRHYHRLFGVIPLPSTSGDDGWMYSIHDRLVDRGLEPSEEVDWSDSDEDDEDDDWA